MSFLIYSFYNLFLSFILRLTVLFGSDPKRIGISFYSGREQDIKEQPDSQDEP